MSTPLRTHLATTSEEFASNARAMRALVDEVRALHDEVLAGGGTQYVERHRARGKMMVRERLEALVDPGTPVLELCPLAGVQTGDPVGGGVVTALAEVSHTQCLVIGNDPTVRGGTTSPTTIRKLSAGHGRGRGQPAPGHSAWSSPAAPTCPARPTSSSPAASSSAA